MAAESNVVLRIGSAMGPGGLASLQAGIQMVKSLGTTVLSTVRELDAFTEILKRSDMAMVNYADAAAKGQIDTLVLMRSLNQIKHAFAATGVEITSEQFKIMAQRATILAQATGRDATQSFKELTDAISKGTTRALKEYGIYVAQSTDIAKTQRDILRSVTDGWHDLNVEIGTTSQKMDALSNNWGTTIGLVWSELTKETTILGKGLDNLNNLLTAVNVSLSEGTGIARQYLFSLGGILDMVREFMGYGEKWSKTLDLIIRYEAVMMGEQKDVVGQVPPPTGETKKKRRVLGGGAARRERHTQADILTPDELEWGANLGRPMETQEDIAAIKAEYAAGMGNVIPLSGGESFRAGTTPIEAITGPFAPGTGPRRAAGDLTFAPESFAVDVDARLEEMKKLEEERMLEQVALMERLEEYKQQQREIYDFESGWQASQIQFAEDFSDTWQRTLESMSSGTAAAVASIDILRGAWGNVVDAAVAGGKNMRQAMLETLHAIGKGLATEMGWRAAVEYVHAIAAAAQRQYGRAAQHTAAGAAYTALAAGGFVVAKATYSSVSSPAAAISKDVGESSGYRPSYGGGSAYGNRELTIRIETEEGMLRAIVEDADRYDRAGLPTLQIKNAA